MGVDNNTLEELKQVCGDMSRARDRSLASLSLLRSLSFSFSLSVCRPHRQRLFSDRDFLSPLFLRDAHSWRARWMAAWR
jgi:hypothetical protein